MRGGEGGSRRGIARAGHPPEVSRPFISSVRSQMLDARLRLALCADAFALAIEKEYLRDKALLELTGGEEAAAPTRQEWERGA
eukprot:COSAG04_NODE_267_length_18528_cov_60.607141_6_plen_83_part_00